MAGVVLRGRGDEQAWFPSGSAQAAPDVVPYGIPGKLSRLPLPAAPGLPLPQCPERGASTGRESHLLFRLEEMPPSAT